MESCFFRAKKEAPKTSSVFEVFCLNFQKRYFLKEINWILIYFLIVKKHELLYGSIKKLRIKWRVGVTHTFSSFGHTHITKVTYLNQNAETSFFFRYDYVHKISFWQEFLLTSVYIRELGYTVSPWSTKYRRKAITICFT